MGTCLYVWEVLMTVLFALLSVILAAGPCTSGYLKPTSIEK